MTLMRGLVEASGWPACPQTRAGSIPTGDGPAGLEQVGRMLTARAGLRLGERGGDVPRMDED